MKCKIILLIFLKLSLYTELVSPGSKAPAGQSTSPPQGMLSPALGGSRSVARPGRFRTVPGDDVRFGSAAREDLTLPAGPHSTFNKEAKKEPLNNVVFQ